MSRRKDFPIRAASFLNTLYERCKSGYPFHVKEMVRMIGISANAPTAAKKLGLARRLNYYGDSGYTWEWLPDSPPTDVMLKTFISQLENYGKVVSLPSTSGSDSRLASVSKIVSYSPVAYQTDLMNSQAMHKGGDEYPENYAARFDVVEQKVEAIYEKLHVSKKTRGFLNSLFTR